MDAYVVVATKGRARETYVLLDLLARQTLPPRSVVVVGAGPSDVKVLYAHPMTLAGSAEVILSPKPGLALQRNCGLAELQKAAPLTTNAYVAFFDDDFRPALDWLEGVGKAFEHEPA